MKITDLRLNTDLCLTSPTLPPPSSSLSLPVPSLPLYFPFTFPPLSPSFPCPFPSPASPTEHSSLCSQLVRHWQYYVAKSRSLHKVRDQGSQRRLLLFQSLLLIFIACHFSVLHFILLELIGAIQPEGVANRAC